MNKEEIAWFEVAKSIEKSLATIAASAKKMEKHINELTSEVAEIKAEIQGKVGNV